MRKTIKARFSRGVLVPLEELAMEEGTEVQISFDVNGPVELDERMKLARSVAGAWKGKIDGDLLKQELYEARRAGSRLPPDE